MPPKPCKCGSTTHARTSHRDCGFNTSAIEEFALSGDFDAALREVRRIRADIDAQAPARAEVEALDAPLAQDPPLSADPLEVCPCCAMSPHTLTTCVAQDEAQKLQNRIHDFDDGGSLSTGAQRRGFPSSTSHQRMTLTHSR